MAVVERRCNRDRVTIDGLSKRKALLEGVTFRGGSTDNFHCCSPSPLAVRNYLNKEKKLTEDMARETSPSHMAVFASSN
jgi:hypothetical protein